MMPNQAGVNNQALSAQPSISDCIDIALAQSDFLLEHVLQGLDITAAKPASTFYGDLDMSSSGKSGVQLLCDRPEAVRATFKNQLQQLLTKNDAQEVPLLHDDVIEDIDLFDPREMGESIESGLALEQVNQAVDQILPSFEALVSQLVPSKPARTKINPIKPEFFVKALHRTLIEHIADSQARSALLVPAAGYMGIGLRRLYRDMAVWLRSAEKLKTDTADATVLALAPKQAPSAPVTPAPSTRQHDFQPTKHGVTHMLEDLILQHRVLPAIASQVWELESTLVKLSDADIQFMLNAQHPALRFLNRLMSRSKQYADQDDAGFAKFHKSVADAVYEINHGAGDSAAFLQMTQWLEDIWSREDAVKPERVPVLTQLAEVVPPQASQFPTDLKLGDWIELLRNGEWVRAQLSWVNTQRTLFMFQSGPGQPHSMSMRMMERLSLENKIRPAANSR